MNSFVLVAFFALFAAASAGILSGAPLVSAYSAPVVSAYSAPVVGAGLVGEQTVVAGPSGTIATGRTFGAPAVAAYASPAVAAYNAPIVSSYAAPGVVARTIW